jgi:acetyl-CoA carboxylase biotin carboxyl carrier protein
LNIVHIKELIAILEGSKLNKLTLKDENGCEIHLEKALAHTAAAIASYPHPTQELAHLHSSPSFVNKAPSQEVSGQYVTSPMVGTFYSAQAPNAPALIKVGDVISENTVVCIIEAMKVMNEIKSGVKGKVVEICHDNGQSVEFGTKLFRVES